LIEHDGSIANIEHDTRLHHGTEAYEVSGIAQYHTALRHAVVGRSQEVGAVRGQENLERSEKVVRSLETNSIDLLRRPLIVRPGPLVSGGYDPADRLA
jgi:hypothetical protein